MLMDNQHKTNSSGINLARKADRQGYIITREHKRPEQKSRTTDKSKKKPWISTQEKPSTSGHSWSGTPS